MGICVIVYPSVELFVFIGHRWHDLAFGGCGLRCLLLRARVGPSWAVVVGISCITHVRVVACYNTSMNKPV
jgi:hypothetical protein